MQSMNNFTELKKAIFDFIRIVPPPFKKWFKFQMNIFLENENELIMTMPMLIPISEWININDEYPPLETSVLVSYNHLVRVE